MKKILLLIIGLSLFSCKPTQSILDPIGRELRMSQEDIYYSDQLDSIFNQIEKVKSEIGILEGHIEGLEFIYANDRPILSDSLDRIHARAYNTLYLLKITPINPNRIARGDMTDQLMIMQEDWSIGNHCDSLDILEVKVQGDLDINNRKIQLLKGILVIEGNLLNNGEIINDPSQFLPFISFDCTIPEEQLIIKKKRN